MSKCLYKNSQFETICTNETDLDSKLCIFHDLKYYQEHPDEISDAFQKK
ncbi:hypothetical protein NZNM25_00860 [Nitrosopumilus zosterae]|uniref:Uncharacterized protein n=1 Tax=Nitrosopumilus zosterae TaxID=718286 RepID=A0A2S2KP76_9ARCH|nr:hypothetical protein NZNM25_00860 [Nitrosopumilus zosterae]